VYDDFGVSFCCREIVAREGATRARREENMHRKNKTIFQFKVTLLDIRPLVWRRIQVPSTYSFWDLHVAIQDAMGWLDYHLHEFRIPDPQTSQTLRIGIPDDDEFGEEEQVLPGWHIHILDLFSPENRSAQYTYDFGDNWNHIVKFEGVIPQQPGIRYPVCSGGARKCPPEDVGGSHGYREFLRAIRNPKHQEHDSYLQWVGGSFDPEAFEPSRVRFDNPRRRWRIAFEQD
jgi:hypothetical protein